MSKLVNCHVWKLRFVDSTVCSLFWLLFLTGPRNITTWLTPLLVSVACVAGLEIEGIRLSLPSPTLYPFFTCHADYVPWHFQTFSVKEWSIETDGSRKKNPISAFRLKLSISSSRYVMKRLYQHPNLRYKDWNHIHSLEWLCFEFDLRLRLGV